jgi:Domain of unknown function (DUF4167)
LNNNNRGNNNRRRGRGNNSNSSSNNRQQGGGGGQQLNRVDSRSRGNAPQMLEKYRKLAHDAHLNGDRVNAEYFLQFADHYFRVIADTRLRQEEQRLRRDERWQEGGEAPRDEADDGNEFTVDSDFPTFDQPPVYTRREREERPERAERPERQPEGRRDARDSRDEPASQPVDDGQAQEMVPEPTPFDPPENPFVREVRDEPRPTRGLRPRREDRRPRRDDRDDEPAGLDPSSLPPPISVPRDDIVTDDAAEDEKPRRRARRKPSADDAGEALETIG